MNAPGAICWAIVTFAFGNAKAAMDSQVAAEATAVVQRVLIATSAGRSVRRVICHHVTKTTNITKATKIKKATSDVRSVRL